MSKLYNLVRYRLHDGKWKEEATVVWNCPYSLCRGEKKKKEATKAHFEFFKIVPNI